MTSPPDARRPRTSLLRHTPTGEAAHFDWMVVLDGSHPGADERTVPCFRLHERLDLALAGSELEILPLPAHRGLYLVLEAARELSRGRGHVEPLRRGEVLSVRTEGEDRVIDLRWDRDVEACPQRPATVMRVRLHARDRVADDGPIRLRVERTGPPSQPGHADRRGSHGPGSPALDTGTTEDHR